MKSFLKLIVIMLIPIFSKGQTVFTMEDCIKKALTSNFQIQADSYDLKKSDAEVMQAVSNFLPQINLAGNYLYYLDIPVQLVPSAFFGGGKDKYSAVRFGVPQSMGGNLQLYQNIYNSQLLIAVQASKVVNELSGLQVRMTRENLIYNVSAVYYNIQALKKRLELVEKNLTNSEKTLSSTEDLYKNGITTKTDYERFLVNNQNIRSQKQSISGEVEKSYNLLKLLMNLPLDQAIAIEPISDKTEINDLSNSSIDGTKRSDFKQLETNIKLNTLDKKRIIRTFQPTLAFTGTFGYNGYYDKFAPFKSFNDSWYRTSFFGVQLAMPVFDGLSRASQIRAKNFELKKLNVLKDQKNESIRKEILDASIDYSNNLSILSAQKQNMELAQKVYKDIQNQYQNGLLKLSDLLNGESQMVEAENNYVNALISIKKADLDLKKAKGELADKF